MVSDLNTITEIFEKMNGNGFDTSGYLNWGFFFLDTDKKHILNVFYELSQYGYNMQWIEHTGNGLWQLYVTKIDILTPEKLHKRNIAFNELAEYCNVQLYDGWDVEKNK